MEIIEEIIQREWDFFQHVQHIDGRASCQDDFETFEKQRTAQFLVYTPELLQSYLNDLKTYLEIGRNPIMEKYAYMMQSSDPEYYKTIENDLPSIDEFQKQIIDTICNIQVSMRESFNQQYPVLASLSRVTHKEEDEKEDTSFETYLRGELMTYSPTSLYLSGQMIINMANHHENMTVEIMKNTVKAYGYKDLDDAEEKMHQQI